MSKPTEVKKLKLINLSVSDRATLMFLPLLPAQGSRLEVTLTSEIIDKVLLSSDDLIDAGFTQEKNGWFIQKEFSKEIDFTDAQIEHVKEGLKKADENKTFNKAYLSIEKAFTDV